MKETLCPAAEVCAQLAARRLPRWDELPDFELYMDQVLSLMERYLDGYPGPDRKGLTASMVNNYVKLGVMPPPVKKKYTRVHLAHLIMICVLKPSVPIDLIRGLIAGLQQGRSDREAYDWFCGEFESSVRGAAEAVSAEPGLVDVCRSALRAQAEQTLALRLYGAAVPEPEQGEKKEKREKKSKKGRQ